MNSWDTAAFGESTLISHFAEESKPEGAVVPPIFQNSLFVFDSSAELTEALRNSCDAPPHAYSRISNPTVQVLERKLAALEATESCRVTGCGMAAIADAIFSVVQSGSHVVAVESCYGPVRTFLSGYLNRFGVTATYVSGCCPEQIFEAIRPDTSLVYLESPSSLVFYMQDVPKIAAECRLRGIATIIDNTYNTPLHFKPATHGVDLICHSITKYIGGHSDLTGGAICGSKARLDAILNREINYMGNLLHPFPAWLAIRGLRTLPIRLKRHEQTANEVAAWLEDRPEIARVHHVGLPSHSQRDLVSRLLLGTGGLFSFEPKCQDETRIRAFCDALHIFGRGISWGGFESLVVPSAFRPAQNCEERRLVRLYCGLEDSADLIGDLENALSKIG